MMKIINKKICGHNVQMAQIAMNNMSEEALDTRKFSILNLAGPLGEYVYFLASGDEEASGLPRNSTKRKKLRKLTAENTQRFYVDQACIEIAERVSGATMVGGAKSQTGNRVPKFFDWTIIINVLDERMIKKTKSGKMYLLIPINPEDFHYFPNGLEVLDGQHRTISFSKPFSKVKGLLEEYNVLGYIHIRETEENKTAIFHSANAECVKTSAELDYRHRLVLNTEAEVERCVYKAAEILASKKVRGEDGLMVASQAFGNINLGRKQGKLSAKNLTQFMCVDENGDVVDDNIVAVLSKFGISTPADVASALNIYMIAWNKAHGVNYNLAAKGDECNHNNVIDLNLFCADTKRNTCLLSRQSYANFVWAMAPACFAVLANKNRVITSANLAEVICTMTTILPDTDLRNCPKIGAGRQTLISFVQEVSQALVEK